MNRRIPEDVDCAGILYAALFMAAAYAAAFAWALR